MMIGKESNYKRMAMEDNQLRNDGRAANKARASIERQRGEEQAFNAGREQEHRAMQQQAQMQQMQEAAMSPDPQQRGLALQALAESGAPDELLRQLQTEGLARQQQAQQQQAQQQTQGRGGNGEDQLNQAAMAVLRGEVDPATMPPEVLSRAQDMQTQMQQQQAQQQQQQAQQQAILQQQAQEQAQAQQDLGFEPEEVVQV